MDKKSINLPGITIHGDFTVLGPMIDIHDNGQVSIYQSGRPKPAKRKAAESPAKKASCAKPMTLKYYKHGNNALLMKQRRRVDLVFRKWNEWGWIDERTSANDFDAFFEGEPRHCNIGFKKNTTVLSVFLRDLLGYENRHKDSIISKQKNVSATSLVKEQFGKTASFDETRLTDDDKLKIATTLYILDVNNPIPLKRGGGDDDYDMSDAAFQAVLSGQLRITKGI